MSTTSPTNPARPRRRRRWVVLALAVLLVVCLPAGLYLYLSLSAEGELRQAIAEADRLEAPHGWRLEDLEAARAVPPEGRNSADTILAAQQLLPQGWPAWNYRVFGDDAEAAEEEREALQRSFQDLEPPAQLGAAQIAALRKELERAKAARDEARKLADLPNGRFPITYAPNFISTLLKNQQDVRGIADLLGCDALLRAQEQDPDGALTACRGILNAGRAVGDEPTNISQLIRIACRGMAVAKAERTLAQGQPAPDALRVFQQALEEEEPQDLLLIAVRGERAGMDRFMQYMEAGGVGKTTGLVREMPMAAGLGGQQVSLGDRLSLYAPGGLKTQHAALLRYLTRVVESAGRPPEQRQDELTRLEATLQSQPVLVRLLVPALSKMAATCQRSQAELRCAVAAVAAERYRRAQGRWPEALEALVQARLLKEVPTDPYDGAPLRYRHLAGGVVIYTLGPDGKDNGGAINRQKPLAEGSDLGFQLWDVAQRRQPPLPPKLPDDAPPEGPLP